jgi:mannitol/fructose-specific phosphotransferase system IIA component (Ntr-type)
MILEQLLQPGCVKMPLQGKDMHSVITELVDVLDSGKLLLNKDVALQAVLAREQLKSTVIGSGVAIPHSKCKAVRESVVAIGIAEEPINFGTVDGNLVSIVILLISPPDQTKQHIQALAKISKLMFDEVLRNKLQKINAAEELCRLLKRSLQKKILDSLSE